MQILIPGMAFIAAANTAGHAEDTEKFDLQAVERLTLEHSPRIKTVIGKL